MVKAPSKKLNSKSPNTVKKKGIQSAPTPGQIFLRELRGTNAFPLKTIANALHKANGERQDALLERLRHGQLIASAGWPTRSETVELPAALWKEVTARSFRVRKRINGSWKAFNYSVSRSLLLKHVLVPQVRALEPAVAKSNAATHNAGMQAPIETASNENESDLYKMFETIRSNVIRTLERNESEATVVVTASNAMKFADTYLGPIYSQERRGRHRTSNTEELLIEMFRQLHLLPYGSLPKQDAFVLTMTTWWNDHLDRTQRGEEWVRNYVQHVWKAIKTAEPPANYSYYKPKKSYPQKP